MDWLRALSIAIALAASGVDHGRADIPIGFSSALTGPYAWVGEPHLAGTELAIADLNAQGGVLGEPLELIIADDGCNAELAPLTAEKLASEAVAVAFGATCSGAAIPASKVYRRAGTLMIEAGATNPRLTDESDGQVFRIIGRDDRQGTIAGDYLADRWSESKIAIVHDGSAFGQGLAEVVKKRLNQRGISEALFTTYRPEAMDYSDLLDELRAASVEVLYLGGYSPEAGLLIRQARDRKYGVQLVAGDSLSTGEFWLVAGQAGAVDDFCDPQQAVVAAEKLVAAGVPLVIGHHCSHSTLPASEVYAAAGILMITPFTTNPKLTEQGFPTVFRMCGRDDRQGRVAGAFLAERFGKDRIAILHDGTTYGQGLAEQIKARLNERGIAEVLFEGIQLGQVDFADEIQKMRGMDVQVLYYAGLRHEAGLLVRQAYDQGYRPQVATGDGVGGEEFALIAGPAADGTLMTYLAPPPATPENALLAERFAAKGYGGSFGLGTFRSYAVVEAWAQAVAHAGTFAPGAVAEALRSHGFDTAVGRIGFDQKGDVTGYGTYVWYVWKDGEFAPLEPNQAGGSAEKARAERSIRPTERHE